MKRVLLLNLVIVLILSGCLTPSKKGPLIPQVPAIEKAGSTSITAIIPVTGGGKLELADGTTLEILPFTFTKDFNILLKLENIPAYYNLTKNIYRVDFSGEKLKKNAKLTIQYDADRVPSVGGTKLLKLAKFNGDTFVEIQSTVDVKNRKVTGIISQEGQYKVAGFSDTLQKAVIENARLLEIEKKFAIDFQISRDFDSRFSIFNVLSNEYLKTIAEKYTSYYLYHLKGAFFIEIEVVKDENVTVYKDTLYRYFELMLPSNSDAYFEIKFFKDFDSCSSEFKNPDKSQPIIKLVRGLDTEKKWFSKIIDKLRKFEIIYLDMNEFDEGEPVQSHKYFANIKVSEWSPLCELAGNWTDIAKTPSIVYKFEANHSPVANILIPATSQTINVNSKLYYKGEGKDEDEGDYIAIYYWTFPGGEPAFSYKACPGWVIYKKPGTFTTEFKVVDSHGKSNIDRRVIKVKSVNNTLPVADFYMRPPRVSRHGRKIEFDASYSKDIEDGEGYDSNLLVRWDFNGDGEFDTNFSYNKVINHIFDSAGKKRIILEVMDQAGDTAVKAKDYEINFETDNIAPEIKIVSPVNNEKVSGTVTVDVEAKDTGGIDIVALEILIDEKYRVLDYSDVEPYTLKFDSTKFHNITYILKAVAYDKAGNSGYTTIQLQFFNTGGNSPPQISNLRINGNKEDIEILYNLADVDNDDCRIIVKYSTDGGMSYKPASVTGQIEFVKPGINHKLIWNSLKDIQSNEYRVKLKLIPHDGQLPGVAAYSNMFHVFNESSHDNLVVKMITIASLSKRAKTIYTQDNFIFTGDKSLFYIKMPEFGVFKKKNFTFEPVALSTDSKPEFIFCTGAGNSISKLQISDFQVVAALTFEVFPCEIFPHVNPENLLVLFKDGQCARISTFDLHIKDSVNLSAIPLFACTDKLLNRFYVALDTGNFVVLDITDKPTLIGTSTTFGNIKGIGFDVLARYIFVCNDNSEVYFVDPETYGKIKTVKLNGIPYRIAVDMKGEYVYTIIENKKQIAAISIDDAKVVRYIEFSQEIVDIASDFSGEYIIAAGAGGIIYLVDIRR